MDDFQNYPACLVQTDRSGHLQSRSKETELSYRKRYIGQIKDWGRRHPNKRCTLRLLTEDIGARAPNLRSSTLKQYHAAIRQALRDHCDRNEVSEEFVIQIDKLLREQMKSLKSLERKAREDGKYRKLEQRTSSSRAKSITAQTLRALVDELHSSKTDVRVISAAMLRYGSVLATRPTEFLEIHEHMNHLWVWSAKYSTSNHRGLLNRRQLSLEGFSSSDVEQLHTIAKILKRTLAVTTVEKLLRRCQRAIRLARQNLGRDAARIAPYTPRHQARANMVAMGMSPEEVAVVMNHASAETAQLHYAKGRSAWKRAAKLPKPKIDAGLLARVRPAKPKPWTTTAYQPKAR